MSSIFVKVTDKVQTNRLSRLFFVSLRNTAATPRTSASKVPVPLKVLTLITASRLLNLTSRFVTAFVNDSQPMLTNLKTLLERFANGSSMDDMFDALNQIYRDADNDRELKDWFKSMDRFIRKCLQQQGFILQDSSNDEWNELYDHGHYLLREKYREHSDHLLEEVKHWGLEFEHDPQNKAFGDAVQKLFLDLGNDESGNAAFKPHLLKDISEVILPQIFENIRYIPIPRIEYQDNMMDAVVENLVIEGDNLAPNVMEFSTDNYWRWGRKKIANKNKNKIMLSVSGIQADLRGKSLNDTWHRPLLTFIRCCLLCQEEGRLPRHNR